MKVLVASPAFCQPGLAGVTEHLAELVDEVVVNPYGRTLTKAEIRELWVDADAIIAGVEPYTADVLADAPASLKVITRYGVGYNSIDIEFAGRKGIAIANTPGVNAPAVADLTLGLMLAVARRIPQFDAKTRQGGWSRYVGVGLSNSTLGIIGLGSIGKQVALRAKGFSMSIIAFDPDFDAGFAAEYGIEEASINEVFRTADFVSLHVPVLPETVSMIDRQALETMKPSAFLINTARGELVDEQALCEALKTGAIAGAALDVFEKEPLLESPLFELENVVVTPHLGGHTTEAEYLMGKLGVENTMSILEGKYCKDVVNQQYLA